MTKDKFVAILRTAGITEDQMHKLHAEFERSDPKEHQRFLEYLNIPQAEIASIRAASAKG
ncbi:hypothetical protein [uncultured Paludibaculum sp.]|uniref:hypothetical protein n=1 Tax=uncultured Paludibaculum sp. TaxID=1765020 RepID=UPI002AAB6350|nr:hypothetical protein [uncultured Paludibaculum sp.]